MKLDGFVLRTDAASNMDSVFDDIINLNILLIYFFSIFYKILPYYVY